MNKSMQQKNATNKKRAMKEALDFQYSVMSDPKGDMYGAKYTNKNGMFWAIRDVPMEPLCDSIMERDRKALRSNSVSERNKSYANKVRISNNMNIMADDYMGLC